MGVARLWVWHQVMHWVYLQLDSMADVMQVVGVLVVAPLAGH